MSPTAGSRVEGCLKRKLIEFGRIYRGTELIRNSGRLEPYSVTMPRALWWSYRGGLFFTSEVHV